MSDRLRLVLVVVSVVLAGCGTATVSTPTDGSANDPVPAVTETPPATSETPSDPDAFRPAERTTVTVRGVVDGDTIDVRFPDGREDRIRLLGVDVPEIHVENDPSEYEGVPDTDAGADCLRTAGQNASAYVEQRLADSNVTVVTDPQADRRGGYDRLLAYVFVDDRNLNAELVELGHARLYDTAFSFRDAFATAETSAQAADRGLWTCRETG